MPLEGTPSVMVIVKGSGLSNPSSNPEGGSLHFTKR